jgi:iron complex transport system substrate-binding protein
MKQQILLIFSLLLFSCSSKQTTQKKETANERLLLSHAKGFEINYFDDYKEVVVFTPWNEGEIMARYFLVGNDSVSVPENGIKIKIPLKSLATASATHLEFLYLLGVENSISGVSLPELIYNEDIRKKLSENKIVNIGEAFNLNFEQVLFLNPDAVMASGFNQTNEKENRISQAGIPIIYNNEWTENTVLGRAEWIKFVSAFYDKESIADSIFQNIENNYNDKLQLVLNTKNKPAVLPGSNFKGTWYIPNSNSCMAHLFRDAGAFYKPETKSKEVSLPLSFEMVLKEFHNADIWIGCSAVSLTELISSDERYSLFKPVQNGEVYNNNKRTTSTGGNDFWESAVARPDIILTDLVKILYPELLPDYELFYMKKLNP